MTRMDHRCVPVVMLPVATAVTVLRPGGGQAPKQSGGWLTSQSLRIRAKQIYVVFCLLVNFVDTKKREQMQWIP